jgi:hypothetical protein
VIRGECRNCNHPTTSAVLVCKVRPLQIHPQGRPPVSVGSGIRRASGAVCATMTTLLYPSSRFVTLVMYITTRKVRLWTGPPHCAMPSTPPSAPCTVTSATWCNATTDARIDGHRPATIPRARTSCATAQCAAHAANCIACGCDIIVTEGSSLQQNDLRAAEERWRHLVAQGQDPYIRAG